MTQEQKYPRARALRLANRLIERIHPWCDRIEIAGSLRREKALVRDVDLVVIPSQIEASDRLFEKRFIRDPRFVAELKHLQITKGDPVTGRQIQISGYPGWPKIELWIADQDNWGYIYALRTGPGDYNKGILVPRLKDKHFMMEKGYLYKHGTLVPVPTEAALFQLIGQDYLDPKLRRYA